MRYNNIIVAVDLSDESEQLIQQADEINRQYFQAEMAIIHVSDQHVTGYAAGMGSGHIANEMQLRQEIFPQLRQICERSGIPGSQIHILIGEVAEKLQEYVAEKACDLIIIAGHKGKHGLRALLSTDSDVLHRSDCDVLTLKL